MTAGLIASAAGCARTPAGVTGNSGSQVTVSVTFNAPINPSDYYFVLFNPVSNPSQNLGPEPVVALPWGNGIATGALTSFMEYNSTVSQTGYAMYQITPNTNFLQYSPLPQPTQILPVSGGNTLQFQIPLTEIPTTDLAAGTAATYLQVNFMATDNITIAQNPNSGATRNLGILGSSSTNWITIPITQSGEYSSNNTPSAPTGAVYIDQSNGGLQGPSNTPALQITNWSVQVYIQS